MNLLGNIFIVVALGMALATVVAGVFAFKRPAMRWMGRAAALWSPLPWVGAAAVLLWALWTGDASVRYVVEHVDSTLPGRYRVAALWAGQEGSLLTLVLLTAVVGALVAWRGERMGRRAAAGAGAVSGLITLSLGLILAAGAPPFRETGPGASLIGAGQQLRHWAMLIHPPLVLCGYALCSGPFAIAAAGSLTGGRRERWMEAATPWAFAAWVSLGAGIVLGAWWAYTQLGWGGYWAWDPVENASLLPWLMMTALVHALAVCRRGASPLWACALALAGFWLCLFGTFITRSGLVQSVHSFGPSMLGAYLGTMIGVVAVGGVLLVCGYSRRLGAAGGRAVRTGGEQMTMGAVLLLCFVTASVLLGTGLPLIATLVLGKPASVATTFYESTVAPAAALGVLLIAVLPVWGGEPRAGRRHVIPVLLVAAAVAAAMLAGVGSLAVLVFLAACVAVAASAGGAVIRGFLGRGGRGVAGPGLRAHGGRVAHAGVCVLLFGVSASSALATSWDVTLRPGETRDLDGWRVTLERVAPEHAEDSICVRADLTMVGPGGGAYALSPRRRHYLAAEEPVGEVSVRSSLWRDVYAGLSVWDETADGATLHLRVLPGVMWIWIGAGIGLAGGAVCLMTPRRHPEPVVVPAAAASGGADGRGPVKVLGAWSTQA